MAKRTKITSNLNSDSTSAEEKVIEQLRVGKQEKQTEPAPQGATEQGKPTVRITVDIPRELHSRIKAHTKSRGQSIKGYLLFLASQDMKQYDAV